MCGGTWGIVPRRAAGYPTLGKAHGTPPEKQSCSGGWRVTQGQALSPENFRASQVGNDSSEGSEKSEVSTGSSLDPSSSILSLDPSPRPPPPTHTHNQTDTPISLSPNSVLIVQKNVFLSFSGGEIWVTCCASCEPFSLFSLYLILL